MGSYQQTVVLRTGGTDWTSITALAEVAADPSTSEQDLPNGWKIVSSKVTPPADTLTSVLAASGTPALWFTVTSMDSTHLRGRSASGGWQGWALTGGVDEDGDVLDVEAFAAEAEALFEAGAQAAVDEAWQRLGEEMVDRIRAEAPGLAAAASRWAAEAGRDVPADRLHALIVEDEPFGSRFVDRFLALVLG